MKKIFILLTEEKLTQEDLQDNIGTMAEFVKHELECDSIKAKNIIYILLGAIDKIIKTIKE